MIKVLKLVVIAECFLLSSCIRSVSDNVLAHYETTGDTTALAAAEFLLNNIEDKYTLSSVAQDDFYAFTDSLFGQNLPDGELRRQYSVFCQERLEWFTREQSDLKTLTAEYFIQHIDTILALYNKPWNNYLTFKDFCEYVLPYRIRHEEPELWAAAYRSAFRDVISVSELDSMPLLDIAIQINQHLMKNGIRIVDVPRFCDGYKASHLLKMKVGQCPDYCALGVFAMRSMGIPCAIDEYPDGHAWNVLLLPGDTLLDFSTCEYNPGEQHVRRWLEYRHWKNVPKVYRNYFSMQAGCLALICGDTPIPDYFRNPCLKDVSASYYSGYDVSVPCTGSHTDRFGYLSVHDCTFQFVAWASCEKGKCVFRNISDSIVYFPSYYREEHNVFPFEYPFVLLCRNGQVVRHRFVPDVAHLQRMVLYRKYHVKRHHNLFLKRALGAVVQGADKPDFSDARTLCRVESVPEMRWTDLPITSKEAFRYVRWLAPDSSYCSVAELQFYDRQGQAVSGKIIGTNGYYDGEPEPCPKEHVFDGNPLTFFDAPEPNGAWVGLDFGQAVKIGGVRFLMRNDDNNVTPGQTYELLYMDIAGWKSMGKCMATADSLVYDNVPSNAVYLLKNLDKGREERIFTYENGRQVWW